MLMSIFKQTEVKMTACYNSLTLDLLSSKIESNTDSYQGLYKESRGETRSLRLTDSQENQSLNGVLV